MTKPKLETALDVEYKNKAKARIEKAWNCKILDLYEPAYRLDWWIPAQNIYIEHKQRQVSKDKYSSVILSMSKLFMMKDLKDLVNAKCLLVVGFTDALMYAEVRADYNYIVTVQKSTLGNVEPVFNFPKEDFKYII